MSKVNLITIKNKQNGFTRTVGEPEFNNMIDKADFEIIPIEEPKPKAKAKKKTTKKKK